MKQVLLGDLVKIIGGGTPSRSKPEYYNGSIPWITVKDFGDELFLWKSKETITQQGLEESATNLIPAGNVILITRMAVGKVAMNLVDVAINQDLKALICKPELDPKYLLFFLLSQKDELESQADGATVKGITIESVNKLKMSLPPLAKQKRIAAIAQKADRLRRTQRYALQLGDIYLQSVFLEMFGDPIRNSKGFETFELEDLASVERGKFTPRPRNDPSYYGGSYPFIQTGDISNSIGRLNRWTQTLNEKGKKVSRSFPPGTVVIAIVGATIGATAILDIEVYCPDSVIGIQAFKERTTPEYIECLLKFWKPIFLAQAPETARANINLDTLRPLKIPLPPISEQQKFSQIVQRFERLCTQQREAERQAEHLFQTLLHRAFRGELTPQDANDEPASVLLEEIRAEQAKAEGEAKAATQAMCDAADTKFL